MDRLVRGLGESCLTKVLVELTRNVDGNIVTDNRGTSVVFLECQDIVLRSPGGSGSGGGAKSSNGNELGESEG